MVTRIAVLGSTGSIGRQTLDVIRAHPEHFRAVALAGGRNMKLLAEQVREHRPSLVAIQDAELGRQVGLEGSLSGSEGLEALATAPEVDLVVVATAGKAGLGPTLRALEAGKQVALANKEVLVMAGEQVTALARSKGITIRPIDSEHSAIWQCLQGENQQAMTLWLTASGGPFHQLSLESLAHVEAGQALNHPTWQMGQKITIDSATLMNKGLEVIEAHWLFGVDYDRIRVVLHYESVIHSLVEFPDGSLKAQLGPADMRIPIQYALSYPERLPIPWPRFDLQALRELHFNVPDVTRFPALRLAYEAGKMGGTATAVLAAADEIAVNLFLLGRIGFLQIPALIEQVLELHQPTEATSLEAVLQADAWARDTASRLAAGLAR